MSGARVGNGGGQLALLDAIVFFSVAILISSLILSQSYAESLEGPQYSDSCYGCDASSVFEVLLRSSIGETIVVDGLRTFTIHSEATVCECLSMELSALISGEQEDAFESLNEVIIGIAEKAVGLSVIPHIHVMRLLDGSWSTVVAIERAEAVSDNRAAASFDLPDEISLQSRISLILESRLSPGLCRV